MAEHMTPAYRAMLMRNLEWFIDHEDENPDYEKKIVAISNRLGV
jgi:hypothetical protein